MGRWLMVPAGFEPAEGKHFTYQTTPAGAWDGAIHCRVLEVKPYERFAYSWRSGHEGNVGYGSPARHRGHLHRFPKSKTARASASSIPASVLPKNDTAFEKMSERLEEGGPEHWRYRRGEGLTRRISPRPI